MSSMTWIIWGNKCLQSHFGLPMHRLCCQAVSWLQSAGWVAVQMPWFLLRWQPCCPNCRLDRSLVSCKWHKVQLPVSAISFVVWHHWKRLEDERKSLSQVVGNYQYFSCTGKMAMAGQPSTNTMDWPGPSHMMPDLPPRPSVILSTKQHMLVIANSEQMKIDI